MNIMNKSITYESWEQDKMQKVKHCKRMPNFSSCDVLRDWYIVFMGFREVK